MAGLEPFVDFKIGKVSSIDLGIIRTSDGSRFNENLLPTSQDRTVQIPGGDGMYYFGSYYTQKQINIPIAFDNMTQTQHDTLITIMNKKELQTLEFAERPGVIYKVKSLGSSQIKWVCFDEGKKGTELEKRIYKGEGTLSFFAPSPFGEKKRVKAGNQTGASEILNNGLPTDHWTIAIPWEKLGDKAQVTIEFGAITLSFSIADKYFTDVKNTYGGVFFNSKTRQLYFMKKENGSGQTYLDPTLEKDCISLQHYNIGSSNPSNEYFTIPSGSIKINSSVQRYICTLYEKYI